MYLCRVAALLAVVASVSASAVVDDKNDVSLNAEITGDVERMLKKTKTKKNKKSKKKKSKSKKNTTTPSTTPSMTPTATPSMIPSTTPSATPSSSPSATPSASPSATPTATPSAIPSGTPSTIPSSSPSITPSVTPSSLPSADPSSVPTAMPSVAPTDMPSAIPSVTPSSTPSTMPSMSPTSVPSMTPSMDPSSSPSETPSMIPSSTPSDFPSSTPSSAPTSCDAFVSSYACSGSDECALYDFFVGLNGCDWSLSTNWLMTNDVCTWYGISCDSNDEVYQINLSDNGLVGTIPTSIGDLTSLERVDLQINSISGIIPTEIGDLPDMELLNLQYNSFRNNIDSTTGVITDSFCDIDIIAVDCEDPVFVSCPIACNCICGNIIPSTTPTEIVTLDPTALVSASPTTEPTFSSDSPSSAPTCDSYVDESYCDTFNLKTTCRALLDIYREMGGCSWTEGAISSGRRLQTAGTGEWATGETTENGLDPMCFWHGVTCENGDCDEGCDVIMIDLSNNNVRGTIPASVGTSLYRLIELDLSVNNIHGTIPSTLGNLRDLIVLLLDQNDITGTVPAEVEALNIPTFVTDCETQVNCTSCTDCGPEGPPTADPSGIPSETPSLAPTGTPSVIPSATPSAIPSSTPSAIPSAAPSAIPSSTPSAIPSATPSAIPSSTPSAIPSEPPSAIPSLSFVPTGVPTVEHSSAPTEGCYENIAYECQVDDPGTSGIDSGLSYGCAAATDSTAPFCQVNSCYLGLVIPPSEACCGCSNKSARAGFVPPSESPTQSP